MSKEHKAVCVIAWPAGHSRSPLIHNYWIKQHKLDAEYRREAVPPDKFAAFVENLRANGYIGANITVPHKEVALAMSEPDDRARAVGAANTLWHDGYTLRSTTILTCRHRLSPNVQNSSTLFFWAQDRRVT